MPGHRAEAGRAQRRRCVAARRSARNSPWLYSFGACLLRGFDGDLRADLAVAGGRCGARRASRRARLREVIGAGGFQSVRRATETPFNMVFAGAPVKTRAVIVTGAHYLARGVPPMGGDRPTRGGVGNAPAESPQAVAGTLGGGSGPSNARYRARKGAFRFGERDRRGAEKRGSETVSM
jgi:hypothetical protein